MSTNASLLTAAREAAVAGQVENFENNVAAHVSGDWGQHNQVLLHPVPFAEFDSGDTISNAYLLRLLLSGTNTDGSGDGVFSAPCIVTGISVDAGGAPIIIRQPVSQTAAVNDTVTFTVTAISSGAVAYQWRKNGNPITDATDPSLVLVNIGTSAQAAYDVGVVNSYGSTASNIATLTVLP